MSRYPWTKISCGGSMPAAMHMAGHQTQWNLRMSLPIRWWAAPQRASNTAASLAVAGHRQVVDERVVPDVEDVPAVPRHRHAPGEGGAGDRHVSQAAPDEAEGLVALGRRADEVGVAVVVVEQALLELAQLEEVVVLLHLNDRAAVHRALAVHELVLGVVVLAGDAVEAPSRRRAQ